MFGSIAMYVAMGDIKILAFERFRIGIDMGLGDNRNE